MAQKYTISKALTQTSTRGFTLIELLVGLAITFLIGGLAMNAFINASNMFSKDKKNIDNDQNLSAILGLIGIDIQQTGEQINDGNFPVMTFQPNTDAGSMSGSSKITIRRALAPALTLCQSIAPNPSTLPSTLVVADNSLTNTSCQTGTPSENTLPSSIKRPSSLMAARTYRCKLDDLNADYTAANTDFCANPKPSPSLEQVRAAISDGAGNIRTFNYTDDNPDTTPTAPSTTAAPADSKFNITIDSLSASTPADNGYAVGNPIYLIEERTYTLTSDGKLQIQVNGEAAQTLIKGIEKFKISARVYGDTSNKSSDLIDAAATPVAPNLLPRARRCEDAVPYYICAFKTATYPADNWKTLQGVKIQLQAKYDPTGGSPTPSQADLDKLTTETEFFPRNILSK